MKGSLRSLRSIWKNVRSKDDLEKLILQLKKGMDPDEVLQHINHLISILGKDSLILEAGCGSGRWVFYLNDLGYTTIGIDIVKDSVRRAYEYGRNSKMPLIVSDVTYLPFRPATFDLILSLGVIEHFPKKQREMAIENVFLTLKPKGIFLLVIPNKLFFPYSVQREISKLRRTWHLGLEKSFNIKDISLVLKSQQLLVYDYKIFGFRYAFDILLGLVPPPFHRLASATIRDSSIHSFICKILRFFQFGFYLGVFSKKKPQGEVKSTFKFLKTCPSHLGVR